MPGFWIRVCRTSSHPAGSLPWGEHKAWPSCKMCQLQGFYSSLEQSCWINPCCFFLITLFVPLLYFCLLLLGFQLGRTSSWQTSRGSALGVALPMHVNVSLCMLTWAVASLSIMRWWVMCFQGKPGSQQLHINACPYFRWPVKPHPELQSAAVPAYCVLWWKVLTLNIFKECH